MFQRQIKSRQAGFIRKLDKSKRGSIELSKQNIEVSFELNHEFSPFKDESPQPIQKILKKQHHKQEINHFKNEKFIDYPFAKEAVQNKKKNRKQRRSNYEVNSSNAWPNFEQNRIHYKQPQKYFSDQIMPRQKKQTLINIFEKEMAERFNTIQEIKNIKALIITETNEEIQFIDSQPQQINISLAESFNLHCHKLKQRLERQRIKFSSKSKQKSRRQNCQSFQQTRPLKKKQSSETNDTKIDIFYERNNKPPMQSKNEKSLKSKMKVETRHHYNQFSDFNKQNCEYISNLNRSGLNSARASLELQSTKFFIPASSSRSKPITPRQAYQHSLKKWKELPQVVAKEKQREKQAQMRERISKMKAHSIQVRRKLKK